MENIRAKATDQVDEVPGVIAGHGRRERDDLDRRRVELTLQEGSLEGSGHHHVVPGSDRRLCQRQRADHVPYAAVPIPVAPDEDAHQPASSGF